MLSFLHICDLGVIGDATLEPAPGLTVVTGETGAGKTLVVTGLSLLLGQKGDPGLVRHGCERALIEGGFTGLGAVSAWLDDLGAGIDEQGESKELLVTRQISLQGRARTSLGGIQVPLATLGDVVGELATIHGQSEQVRLATPERQREVLDRASGPEAARVLAQYRHDYARRRAAITERDELVAKSQARAREAEMLRFGLDEIAAVNPEPAEDVALGAEAHRLQDVDDLRTLAAMADAGLSGAADDGDALGAVGLVGQARKAIDALSRLDPSATELAQQAVSALDGVSSLAAEVASYLSSLEADPVRLEAITARRAELQALTRKYGDDIDEVLAWARNADAQLANLVSGDERIEKLTAEIAKLDGELAEQAAIITAARQVAGERVSRAVAVELAALAMPSASLRFHLETLDELGPWGAESVHLLFTANAGSPPALLSKVASGGELSRVRLALEVVLASSERAGQTFVFDEVDAGVGGAVGLEIGRRLARLAQSSQVIVVTHLAQVAAWADRHYVVTKREEADVTTADVGEVADDARVVEIARMMGGLADSQAGLQHARDLLAAAGR